jgi:hypothetical protein
LKGTTMFNYDWCENYADTLVFENDFSIKWQGEGWYKDNNDNTMLAIIKDELVFVHVWYGRDPRAETNRLINLPEFKHENIHIYDRR